MAESTPERRAQRAAYMREWRQKRQSDPVKVEHDRAYRIAYSRARYKKLSQDPEWVKDTYARNSEYRRRNPEKELLRTRKWAQANAERERERTRAWQRRNSLRRKECDASHKARTLGVDVRVIIERDLRRLLAAGCAYCGGLATQFDHVFPFARGGRHAIGNLVGVCKPCNLSKQDRLLADWRLRRKKV